MYQARLFAVRQARAFEWIYQRLERLMIALDPVFARIGYNRVERPIALVERGVKGLLFDCQMCGQCVLSSTGMSCPMNCPKQLRNGPCGGVRPGGYCEVRPLMKCVWCLAWDGATQMRGGDSNNAGSFSSDYVGGNYRWPDGTYEPGSFSELPPSRRGMPMPLTELYEIREDIFQDHVNYQQGLVYFLAHDPQVPQMLQERGSATRTLCIAGKNPA